MTDGGSPPAYYETLAAWAWALFVLYCVVGSLSLVVFGAAVVQTELVSPWAGWATIVCSVGSLLMLLIRGHVLPDFHYIPPSLIGVLLLAT